jgi:hypothetical protein
MSRWFRFHAAAMRNPKVARLSDKEFRLWVELLATACENDGFITCLDHLSTGVERLISMGLIDRLEHGYEPHGWSKHQYKSDTSTDRVQKHREKRNVSVTPPDTDTEQITDTEYIEPKGSCPSDDEPALKPEHVMEVWNASAPRLGKPSIRTLTPERRQLLKARIGQYSLDDFQEVFGKIERSAFLRGDTGWRGCTFDWVFKKANFQKIIEGNYDQ